MLDLEHSKIIYSDTFINLTEGTTEYYDKKIEKWQKSLPSELILPEYFLKSSTIEELKENWKKAQ